MLDSIGDQSINPSIHPLVTLLIGVWVKWVFLLCPQTFLGRSSSATKEAEKRQRTLPKMPTKVEPRHNVFDAHREATSIVLSGSSRVAAMTDNFGRVLLLDCGSGYIVRMWKGYRDAEVAWITLVDNRSGEIPKKYAKYVFDPNNYRSIFHYLKLNFNHLQIQFTANHTIYQIQLSNLKWFTSDLTHFTVQHKMQFNSNEIIHLVVFKGSFKALLSDL